MFQRWGRKCREARMHKLAKETLYSPFKSQLTFLNLFYVLSVAVHMMFFQQVTWHVFGLFSDRSVCQVLPSLLYFSVYFYYAVLFF